VTAPDTEQAWYTRAEAEQYTRTSKRTILRAVAAGELESTKVGGRGDLRFRHEWLEAWLTKRSAAETTAS
jgi:excisionase family DNA binding protein